MRAAAAVLRAARAVVAAATVVVAAALAVVPADLKLVAVAVTAENVTGGTEYVDTGRVLSMEAVAAALRERVATATPRLRAMPETEAAHKPAPDRWSKKEILGHLIDSACNNHLRFVRAQLEGGLTFPGYEQEGWARCQGYAGADWNLLIDLWSAYNRHLAEVIARLPAAALNVECRIGNYKPATLAWLAEDYLAHMDGHLAQLARPM